MPNTRSKKKVSPYKALKTPARSPHRRHETSPKKAKSRKKSSRMDRMEEQIAALASLVTTHMNLGPQGYTTPTKEAPRTPKKRRRRHDRLEYAFPPPPEAIDDDPGIHDQITDALTKLDPAYKPSGGKKSTVKRPHMFIPKRLRDQRLKVSEQEDVQFPHFVTGMAGMVLSLMDDQASPAAAACRHLREAAEDHILRPWKVVRDWSKTLFDRMNAGEIEWDDYAEMQRERLMICLSAPPKQPTVVPCPYFSAGNCEYTSCHEEGELSLRHICPFCYAAGGGRQDHPIFKCNTKRAHSAATKSQFNKQHQKPKVEYTPKN